MREWGRGAVNSLKASYIESPYHSYWNCSPENTFTDLEWFRYKIMNREDNTGRLRKWQMRSFVWEYNLVSFWSAFSQCHWSCENLVNHMGVLGWKRQTNSTLQREQRYEGFWWMWPYPPQRGQVCCWVWWTDGDNVFCTVSIPVPWQRGQRIEAVLRAIAEQTGHSISRDQAMTHSEKSSVLNDWRVEWYMDTKSIDVVNVWSGVSIWPSFCPTTRPHWSSNEPAGDLIL